MQQLPLAMRLRERAVFESFVAGPNLQALEHLRATALGATALGATALGATALAATAEVSWIYGPAGVGKSHLLQAACALAQSRGHKSAYLPLSQLLALGPGTLEGWQDARVLALDDLACIAGDRDWEQGVFGLYREAQELGAALILAAVEPPLRLRFALPDLASRFAAATLLGLRPLDEAEQREALRLRARARGLELPEETALYLQRRFPRDLSTLYTLLDTVDAAALEAQRRLTVPFIRSVLG